VTVSQSEFFTYLEFIRTFYKNFLAYVPFPIKVPRTKGRKIQQECKN